MLANLGFVTPWHPFLCLPVAISLMKMAGSVADVRGTFRLEYEFPELSKRIGFGQLNLRNCPCSKLECRTRGARNST